MDKTYYYNVPDCEHDGDIRDAVSEVEDAGGKVVGTYWDGEDCGEAYVEYTVPEGVDPDDVYRKLHSGRGFYGKCNAIARKIVAADGRNALEGYFRFYNDGKWMVQVSRRLDTAVSAVCESITAYSEQLPKIEECIGYIEEARLSEMNTASCAKELRARLKDMKAKYSAWEKASDDERGALADEFMSVALVVRDYVGGFRDSCVNAFRNRYIDDEENVRNLLDVIRTAGNFVLNDR